MGDCAESIRVSQITSRREVVLREARARMGPDGRVPQAAIGRAVGFSKDTIKADLAALRRQGLLPPPIPATPRPAQPRPPGSGSHVVDVGARARRREEERLAAAFLDCVRGQFEAAARDYEATAATPGTSPADWLRDHDRLAAAVLEYARLLGGGPCVCDGWRYLPMPAERSFVRESYRATTPVHRR